MSVLDEYSTSMSINPIDGKPQQNVAVTGISIDSVIATDVGILGNLVVNQTNKTVTANISAVTDYEATKYSKSKLQVMADTSGVLYLVVDEVPGTLNSGVALIAGCWYDFSVSLLSGSTYNLRLSVNATMQIKWQAI